MREGEFMRTKAIYILVIILISAFASSYGSAADEAKIVVMNPRGIQPEIRKIPMAARPATLDGKTVYIVDTKYPNTKPFVEALFDALKAKYPKTTWILRDKFAGYMDDDPKLWAEIKEKGAGAIVLLGH
jgi:ABC-type branched-subunit amino acid transport system substrate-binding protein